MNIKKSDDLILQVESGEVRVTNEELTQLALLLVSRLPSGHIGRVGSGIGLIFNESDYLHLSYSDEAFGLLLNIRESLRSHEREDFDDRVRELLSND